LQVFYIFFLVKKRLNPHIGLFDSGIGGMSILKELRLVLPEAQFSYIADEAFSPYGGKDQELLIKRALALTEKLQARGVDLIILACNTITLQTIDLLRETYKKVNFVGVEPFLNLLQKYPHLEEEKWAALVTPATAASRRFEELQRWRDPDGKIKVFACHGLASIVENFYRGKIGETELREQVATELSEVKAFAPSQVVLGCTHYPLIRLQIADILGARCHGPCPYVANRVLDLLSNREEECSDMSRPSLSDIAFFSTLKNSWGPLPFGENLLFSGQI
jgi:glutamate racemase